MVNNIELADRIKKIIDHYELSASGFADNIGVQRSSISHILSGRNKPSLDFILKITDTFPEVNLYWLLNGTGSFIQKQNIPHMNEATTLFDIHATATSKGKITRIVVFFEDGTFSEYHKS